MNLPTLLRYPLAKTNAISPVARSVAGQPNRNLPPSRPQIRNPGFRSDNSGYWRFQIRLFGLIPTEAGTAQCRHLPCARYPHRTSPTMVCRTAYPAVRGPVGTLQSLHGEQVPCVEPENPAFPVFVGSGAWDKLSASRETTNLSRSSALTAEAMLGDAPPRWGAGRALFCCALGRGLWSGALAFLSWKGGTVARRRFRIQDARFSGEFAILKTRRGARSSQPRSGKVERGRTA